ncbi:MAG TPA: TIGR01777 family oxidoreductase [Vicinamibacterales bacterium]|nr:TIGR01777 family oxidoreductase [Vicinamibacterales bacterium]
MLILVAGGTGLLGTALIRRLRADAHRVRILTRRPRHEDDLAWAPEATTSQPWIRALDDADAIVNLAGESIGGGRWSAARKDAILNSRLHATRALVTALAAAAPRARVLISASAVGVYGNRGDETLTEASAPGSGFLADVCREWERLALDAASASRIVLLRTGLVLSRQGGALSQLALPFRLFVGGPAGTGRQYMSWIHIDDWVAMVRWALTTTTVSGPLNLTAPSPVTNTEFARTLGRVLGRPAFMRAPAFALKIVLGEMADGLILEGQRVLPARAEALKYGFKYSTLEPALRALYSHQPGDSAP